MKSISFLLLIVVISFSAFGQSYDEYDYDPQMEDNMYAEEPEYLPEEEYAPGEIERQEEMPSDWNLSNEEIPMEDVDQM